MKVQEIRFNNPGVLIASIPDEIWEPIRSSIDDQISKKEILKKFKFQKLGVNGIAESIKFKCPNEFVPFYTEFITEYQNYFDVFKNKTAILENAWINIQQKHEYRPVHKHDGHLSFVLWHKIPYSIKNEDSLANMFNNQAPKTNGRFQFVFSRNNGNLSTHHIDVDSSFEGKMILFDSSINHQIFPFFTSDETRISVAGNFKFTGPFF